MESLPLFKENEERGNYNTILYDLHRTSCDVWINMSYDEPVWQKVVQDLRFRQALNYAINRDEILDAVYFDFAEKPSQFPTEFNVAKANRLLDEMGMNKKDSEGFRLGPDGKRFTIPIEYTETFGDFTPVAELVADYWKNVGINVTTKALEGGLRATRKSANELKATLGWSSATVWWNFVPFLAGDENFGPAWSEWWTSGGVAGVEPTLPAIKEFYSLMDKAWVVSPEERKQVVKDFTQLMYDNVFWFGIVDKAKYAVLINKDMGNVAKKGFGIGAQFAGEQYFFRTRN
jgi:peptide/nickel transport system substrate-binding protein